METKDSSGSVLVDGDSVKTIKDLKVKSSSMVVKQGKLIKNIRLIVDNGEEVDCRVDGIGLTLEARWLQRV